MFIIKIIVKIVGSTKKTCNFVPVNNNGFCSNFVVLNSIKIQHFPHNNKI